MNNGKVRIYDLSKELNLDNKELLAICDQLDIAVKSHSSTISESEAEQIRSAAEKVVAANLASKKGQGTNGHKPNSSQNRPSANHKQQILEIRKPKILRNTTTNLPDTSVAANAAEANSPSPPRPFATPVSSMKPTAPTRPVPRNQSETPLKPHPTQPEQVSLPQPVGEKVAAEKSEKISTPRPKPEKAQKPQLVSPSPRVDGTKVPETLTLGTSEKPLLKRDRPQRVEEDRQPIKGKASKPSIDQGLPSPPPKPSRANPSAPTRPEQRGSRPSVGGDIQRPRPARPGEPAAIPTATPPRHNAGGGKKEALEETP
ncbi:MAG: translation initiation factor IF-2 N-terminal domain-containing protein, partial [Aphanizomenon sp.]